MTVKELVEELNQLPEDTRVCVNSGEGFFRYNVSLVAKFLTDTGVNYVDTDRKDRVPVLVLTAL